MRFLLPVIAFALLATTPRAYPRLPEPLPPVAGNPADTLLDAAIENPRCGCAENSQALARRYDACYTKRGKLRGNVHT